MSEQRAMLPARGCWAGKRDVFRLRRLDAVKALRWCRVPRRWREWMIDAGGTFGSTRVLCGPVWSQGLRLAALRQTDVRPLASVDDHNPTLDDRWARCCCLRADAAAPLVVTPLLLGCCCRSFHRLRLLQLPTRKQLYSSSAALQPNATRLC